MEWLSQNWTWIVLAAGALWLFSRNRHGGMAGGCCGGMAHEGPDEARNAHGSVVPNSPVKEAHDPEAQPAMPAHRRAGGCH